MEKTLVKESTIVDLTAMMQVQLNNMSKTGRLFRSSLTGQEVWELYINSFNNDPVFRDPNSSQHKCNLCNNFIRRYGNIVAVVDNKIVTLWDIDASGEFRASVEMMSQSLRGVKIQEVFFETFNELNSLNYEKCNKGNSTFKLGINKNVKRYTKDEAEKFGVVKPDEIRSFNHMHVNIPAVFVDMSGKSIEAIMGEYRDAKNVFQRAMEDISLDTLILVKDLINQGSLLDGASHLYKIEQFIPLKEAYHALPTTKRDNWCWVNSYKLPFAKFKNELIGVLCTELSQGEELNKACQSWNKRVDPANYMKVTAPITKKQIEEAKKFVEDNGYVESFDRRFATIDDIKASEILHLNSGKGDIKSVSIFDGIKSTSTRHKRSEFDGVEEVPIDKFMTDILPGCTSVEAFLQNQHEGNLVSLTTSNKDGSRPIFKWDNNYSWTFNGNLAGKSQIKDNVKSAGGKITGVLRTSLQWNDEDTKGSVDFDLHCIQSNGSEIYYANKKCNITKGWLDVDMIRPSNIGIENVTWQDKLRGGEYSFFVSNFDGGSNKGFKVEIEFEGNVFNYIYPSATSYKQDITVATVKVNNGKIDITHHLKESSNSREIYGLETNQFHKVNLMCLTPNHWGTNNVGNKHYLMMIDGCKSPAGIRSFHNENLITELATHRKVLEVLGNTSIINTTDKQLSGLGFNATVRDEVILRLQGSHKRVVKVKF